MKCYAHNPPEGTHLAVKHYRSHEISLRDRYNNIFKWVTRAILYNKQGDAVGIGWAYCCSKDQPSKKIGFLIAGGRAIKEYIKR